MVAEVKIKPRITVLTTVYNGISYLAECIESVLGQTFTDFEFLIVDDASTDGSLECIELYRDPRIRLVKNDQNMGQAKSLNKGLGLAAGEYIARLDQDDVCLPTRLQEQAEYLDNHSDVTVICSWEITIDSTGRKVRTWEASIDNYGDFLGTILLGLCPVWHPSVMFRRETILKLGSFDTSYGPAEDYELWSRIALNRMSGALVPKYHLLQRVHDKRQSHLQREKQQNATARAHNKVVAQFSLHPVHDCMAALLRLDKDPCGRGYERSHVKEIRQALTEMLGTIESMQNLSSAESDSLRKRIDDRLGIGMRYANLLIRLPDPLFYPTFFALSPSLIPNVRSFASNVYNRLRYRR